MDLGFPRFDTSRRIAMPLAFATILVGVAARQAASRTARVQARLVPLVLSRDPLRRASGAFNPRVARLLRVAMSE